MCAVSDPAKYRMQVINKIAAVGIVLDERLKIWTSFDMTILIVVAPTPIKKLYKIFRPSKFNLFRNVLR